MTSVALNQIFFGPPGTGKTYATVSAAVGILDPTFATQNAEDRTALKQRFDSFIQSGDVTFVTFHQSFSYEDFVEGIRAQTTAGQLTYEVADGVFKRLCNSASTRVVQPSQVDPAIDISGRRIWKMSLGNSVGDDSYIFAECIANKYALLGWGGATDFSSCMTRDEVYATFLKNGYTSAKDSYPVTAVTTFLLKLQRGDIIVVTEGNSKFRAIGEIVGDYRVINRDEQGDDYAQCRDVKWLRIYEPSLPYDKLMNNRFSQMTLYQLNPDAIDNERLLSLLTSNDATTHTLSSLPFTVGDRFGNGYEVVHVSNDIVELIKPNKRRLPLGMSIIKTLAQHVRKGELSLLDIRDKKVFERIPDSKLEPHLVNGYETLLGHLVERAVQWSESMVSAQQHRTPKVIIIDEINRGNVSRIFGELITLIEPSKRRGALEELEVVLPYSKERFSVPDNLYIIGTMNSADRSLASLDIALRRRFNFVEVTPDLTLLNQTSIQGLNIGELLHVLNARIEVLLDRDHCIGHAYFMPLRDDSTLECLSEIFRDRIIPLLQEYFFDDWTRIQLVLNDHQKSPDDCFLVRRSDDNARLFGDSEIVHVKGDHWTIRDDAFARIEAFVHTIDANRTIQSIDVEREAAFEEYNVKQLPSGSIEVWTKGSKVPMARPTLLAIAGKLNVSQFYTTGTVANTREIGKRVLAALIPDPK